MAGGALGVVSPFKEVRTTLEDAVVAELLAPVVDIVDVGVVCCFDHVHVGSEGKIRQGVV